MNTQTATRTQASPTRTSAPRADLYAPIHKALRHFMTDTLHRVGRLDVTDAQDMERVLGQLDKLLIACVNHIHKENDYMHPAIEARAPRGASRTADDHVEHFEAIDALRAETDTLRHAPEADRPTLALRLYRHLALFVADNFQHMHFEETQNNAALWAHYSDAELFELHDRILAAIPPTENLEIGRWMVPAANPMERAAIVGSMQAKAPAPAFEAMLAVIRPHLDDTAWDKLARALGIPQAPGLVDVR
jgi:hypothetical protein